MTADSRASLFLLLMVLVPAAWGVRCLFRKPYTPLQWMLYLLNVLLVRLMWRAELPRWFPLAPGQGAIVICNHRSSIDPCFIQAVARKRLVHWMVAQLYGEKSPIGRILKTCGFISIRQRGSDTSAVKTAIRLAKNGELVGILPEGHINTTEQFMLKVRPGAVVIALKAGVPVLPCYIEGSPYSPRLWWPLLMPARVKLRFGPPIDLSPYHGRERDPEVVGMLMQQCLNEIAKLAGIEGFQMEMAGRQWKGWSDWR